MIETINFNGKKLNLHLPQKENNQNIFTTIVGKNGSGKSRFLNHIVTKCISRQFEGLNPENKDTFDLPTAIIALSTSPFDRFPLEKDIFRKFDYRYIESDLKYYHYLGLRGLYSPNLSMSFMVRTIAGLIQALSTETGRIKTVLGALNYLGFNPAIKANLACDVTLPVLIQIATSDDPFQVMHEYLTGKRKAGNEFRRLMMQMDQQGRDERYRILESIKYYIYKHRTGAKDRSLGIVITDRGVYNEANGASVDDKLVPMMESGLLKLRSLELHKKGHDKLFKISDASSGEQCIVLAMLGIASQIRDGALVCIDEPEVCLHPEWQERYIDLLMNTFKGFNSCHFIIATHSPQIVSRLESENCYILDINKSLLRDAADSNRRSADYQLANIFSAPGFKNEYLMRELLKFISQLSQGRKLSTDDLKVISKIHSLKSSLDESDPVLQLYSLVMAATSEKRSDD